MRTDSASLPPCQPFPRGKAWLGAALALVLAMLVLAGHFLVTSYISFLAFPWLVLVSVLTAFIAPPIAFSLLVSALFFQNSFIALFQPMLHGPAQFSLLQGTSFLIASLLVLTSSAFLLRNRHALPAPLLRLTLASWGLVALVVLYGILGALNAPPMSALTYVRLYLIGPFLLLCGLAFGFQLPEAFFKNTLRLVTALLVLWGLLEFTITLDLYRFFHVTDYLNFKFANRHDAELFTSVGEAIDANTRPFLNITGALGDTFNMLRLNGPNIHPISYGYSLALCSLVCAIYRFRFMAFIAFLFTVLVGAKGPIIMMVMAYAFPGFYRLVPRKRLLVTGLSGALLLFVVVGLAYGLYTRDYHVIGFFGGVNGFLANPLGRGIGVGGNLSTLGFEATDWQAFQDFGASFARESAVGVMLYQIGLAGLIFAHFCWGFWKQIWKMAMEQGANPRLLMLPVALAFLAVNALFQEEALSPAGWGLMMLISGLILAQHWRKSVLQSIPLPPFKKKYVIPAKRGGAERRCGIQKIWGDFVKQNRTSFFLDASLKLA